MRSQTRVTAEVIAGTGSLQVIGRAGAGLDNIDVPAATAAGIVVTSTPEQNALSVAELTLAMLVALARRLPGANADTKAGRWSRNEFTGTELFGKTLGLVGFGRIGFMVAMRARAFGMNILAHDELVSVDAPAVVEARATMVGLDQLLEQSDYVSCHLPATPQTRDLFNAGRFARMKRSAYFLNLARGEIVDEPALINALQSGAIAGAALDVRATEPPEPGPLNQMPNVILTPHIAAFTLEAQDRVLTAVCRDDVAAVLEGRLPRLLLPTCLSPPTNNVFVGLFWQLAS